MKVQEHDLNTPAVVSAFATSEDHETCRLLHKKFGTSYYFATQRFRPELRRRVHALYGFVRVPDEWVDNPGVLTISEQRTLLGNYRSELLRGLDGVQPSEPVLRAFCDVMREVQMPIEEPLIFLDAMEADLTVERYPTYPDLQGYMRGSASAVGVMMCYVLGVGKKPGVLEPAMALGEAMQLTNFLRDVREDSERGRIYLPLEDMNQFGVSEADLFAHRMTPQIQHLLEYEIVRARGLYRKAQAGISLLPKEAQKAVLLALALYAEILLKIEGQNYDVFVRRARTTRVEKVVIAGKIMLGIQPNLP